MKADGIWIHSHQDKEILDKIIRGGCDTPNRHINFERMQALG